jgi:hypothetical protein
MDGGRLPDRVARETRKKTRNFKPRMNMDGQRWELVTDGVSELIVGWGSWAVMKFGRGFVWEASWWVASLWGVR